MRHTVRVKLGESMAAVGLAGDGAEGAGLAGGPGDVDEGTGMVRGGRRLGACSLLAGGGKVRRHGGGATSAVLILVSVHICESPLHKVSFPVGFSLGEGGLFRLFDRFHTAGFILASFQVSNEKQQMLEQACG